MGLDSTIYVAVWTDRKDADVAAMVGENDLVADYVLLDACYWRKAWCVHEYIGRQLGFPLGNGNMHYLPQGFVQKMIDDLPAIFEDDIDDFDERRMLRTKNDLELVLRKYPQESHHYLYCGDF
jgi:hypothetical protein